MNTGSVPGSSRDFSFMAFFSGVAAHHDPAAADQGVLRSGPVRFSAFAGMIRTLSGVLSELCDPAVPTIKSSFSPARTAMDRSNGSVVPVAAFLKSTVTSLR